MPGEGVEATTIGAKNDSPGQRVNLAKRYKWETDGTCFERNPGIKWRLILLGLSMPLMLVAGVFTWPDYDSRQNAMITEVQLQS